MQYSSFRPFASLLASITLLVTAGLLINDASAAEPTFGGQTLRGISAVNVLVDGVERDFERYGLTAGELHRQAVARLGASGIKVVDASAAASNAGVAELKVNLKTNKDPFAFYSYHVAVQLKRKIPLDPEGHSFVTEMVWSRGQNGVIVPSDLKRMYGYVDTLLGEFIADYGRHNPASTVSLAK